MSRMIAILLIALSFEAIGVVFLSKGLKQVGTVEKITVSEVARLIKRGITNHYLVLGVFFEAIFFVGLLMLMSKADVSFVWPLTSLSFVFTTVAARFFLHEQVSAVRWTGVLLIMAGAALISWSEKARAPKQEVATVQSIVKSQF